MISNNYVPWWRGLERLKSRAPGWDTTAAPLATYRRDQLIGTWGEGNGQQANKDAVSPHECCAMSYLPASMVLYWKLAVRNNHNHFAMCLVKEEVIIGHVPWELSCKVSYLEEWGASAHASPTGKHTLAHGQSCWQPMLQNGCDYFSLPAFSRGPYLLETIHNPMGNLNTCNKHRR